MTAERIEWYDSAMLSAAKGRSPRSAPTSTPTRSTRSSQGLPAIIADGMIMTNWCSSMLVEQFGLAYVDSYLPRCGTRCDVVPGDGRLSIMNAPDKEFDLLVLDAFNSDAIPAHLLSREAVEIYKQKLKPHGAILFHVSNGYLRIRELVTALAFEAKLPAFYRSDDNDGERGKARSMYVIAAMDVGSIRESA